MQPFTIGLRSQVAGDEILIECESKVRLVDLQEDAVVDALMDALDGGGAVKLCVDPRVGKHQDRIYVRRDILFDPDATRLADVRAMFGSTLCPPPCACTLPSKTPACSAPASTDGRPATQD